jgi:ribulose kinase
MMLSASSRRQRERPDIVVIAEVNPGELLDAVGLDESLLVPVVPGTERVGTITSEFAADTGLPDSVGVVVGCGGWFRVVARFIRSLVARDPNDLAARVGALVRGRRG